MLVANKTLQQHHKPLDIAIVRLLLTVIPEDWHSIRLDVENQVSTSGDDQLAISISGDQNLREIVMPPEELYEKVIAHLDIFKRFARPWSKLVYSIVYDENQGEWRYTIEYEYPK